MKTSAERTQNMAAVQLGNGEEIERGGEEADPCGAANGMKQERAGRNAGMEPRGEETQQQRSAEGHLYTAHVVEAGDNFGVENAVGERGNRQNEPDKRTGSAHVKECANGTNGRTNQNECAEGAHERWEGNEERIAGANVMMAAGEEMAEFMSEENGEQSESEGQAGGESGGVFVKKSEGVEEFVEGDGLIVGVGDGKLSAGDEAGAKSEEK